MVATGVAETLVNEADCRPRCLVEELSEDREEEEEEDVVTGAEETPLENSRRPRCQAAESFEGRVAKVVPLEMARTVERVSGPRHFRA